MMETKIKNTRLIILIVILVLLSIVIGDRIIGIKITEGRRESRVFWCSKKMKDLAESLKRYKIENNGRYPDRLDEIPSKYFVNGVMPICIIDANEFPAGPHYNYEYIKPSPNAPSDTIILIDNNHPDYKIFGHINGKVESIRRPFWSRIILNYGR